jgi:hypothetical protein
MILAGATSLSAQEAAPAISFEPMSEGADLRDWQALTYSFLIAVTGYSLWRGTIWFVERKRHKIPWRLLHRWWPSSALGTGALIFGFGQLFSRDAWGATVQDVTMAFAFILNLPAIALAAPILSMGDELSPSPHFAVVILSVWSAWYVLLIFLEWRAFVNEWIFLRLN